MRVRDLDDSRWQPALELLLSGSGTIELGDIVSITWWTQGVHTDESVRVAILSDTDPRFLTTTKGAQLIDEGLDLVSSARSTYPELDSLMGQQAVRIELIYDYGKGSVRIARIAEDRSIEWEERLVGREHGTSEENGS